jgi:hypothetical protein
LDDVLLPDAPYALSGDVFPTGARQGDEREGAKGALSGRGFSKKVWGRGDTIVMNTSQDVENAE